MRDFAIPGRSAARSTEAMAATSHPLATATCLEMLRRGGSAMDASIAAAAVLSVVEPAETGIGGDCYALIAPAGRLPPLAFNGAGRSPAACDIGWYGDQGFTEIPDASPHSVTVPGAIDAWCRMHERFGKLDFAELLQPAIRYAESGYVVHERVAQEWDIACNRLTRDPEAAAVFLADGGPPALGSVVRNPGLASVLQLVAQNGRSGFYDGEVAEVMVGHLRQLGGLHTLDDFADAEGEFVEPISITYGGQTVYQLPPNTQGAVALLMLRILEKLEVRELDFFSPERIHLGIEAGRVGYALRDRLLGDAERSGEFMDILCDSQAIERLAGPIRHRRAALDLPPVKAAGTNTVYLTVVDSDRNVVSFINSIFHSFGSGICPPGTGVLLQNRGHSFQLDPRHPNAIGPKRRPMHTIIPGLVGSDGRAELSFGVMGGDYQPMGHAHLISAIYDHGLDLQAACDAARYAPVDDRVDVEVGINQKTREALGRWGHKIAAAPQPLGGAQAIRIDWQRGTLIGGSDPRKDGCALGY